MVIAANGPDLATVALRPHTIWGPGDNQIFPRLVERRLANRLVLIGRGENLVDTTYVDNAARAHLDAARQLAPGALLPVAPISSHRGIPATCAKCSTN